MKQHITIEQLNELNDTQRIKLIEWCSKLPNEPRPLWHMGMAQLNIGQMIEFLDEKDKQFIICKEIPGVGKWIVQGYDDYEVCDALWSACKEVLNET